jgi:alanine racemase
VNRGAVAEIHLFALAHNLDVIRNITGNRRVISVVKADAYGHGSIEVSKKLVKEETSFLAVAYSGEAVQLRNSGISAPVIVLFDSWAFDDFFDYDLIPVLHDVSAASALSEFAEKRGSSISVHVKIDTGMGRLGLLGEHAVVEIMKISSMKGIHLTGLMSHFSDADLSDRSYAMLQLERFRGIRDEAVRKLNRNLFSHIANSSAILTFEDAYLDAVRPGIMLYGYSPLDKSNQQYPDNIKLLPAMRVKTSVLAVRNIPAAYPVSYARTFHTKRQSRIGLLPVGYADGFNRLFSNNADVLVRGKRAPVVGRVCMDLTMVDLTEIAEAREGDEVILLGEQGGESITAQELADRAKTIPYEILTSLGKYSRRIYFDVPSC